jgi:hypothetical protein
VPSARTLDAGNAVIKLSLQDKVSQGLSKVQARLDRFGDSLKSVGALGLRASAAIGAPFVAAIKFASDAQETLSKFSVVFGEQTKAMRAWGDELARQVGRSKFEVAGALASFQDLFVPMGMAADQAAAMSKAVTALAIDLGSFNNMADADVIRDLQAALTGSGETMKKYGVIVSEAAVKQELLNMKLNPKSATEAEKAQARLNIIMRGTTAAQGDAIRTADGFANQMKALKSRIHDAAVEVGNALLPAVTKIVAAASEAAKRFADWATENQGLIVQAAEATTKLLALSAAFYAVGAGAKAAAAGVAAFKKVAAFLAAAGTAGAGIVTGGAVAAGAVGGVAVGSKIKGEREAKALEDWRRGLIQRDQPSFALSPEEQRQFNEGNAARNRKPLWQTNPQLLSLTPDNPLEGVEAKPAGDQPLKGAGFARSLLDGFRGVVADAQVSLKAAALRAQFEAQGPLARGRKFLSQFKQREVEGRSMSVLDARFASQQFGRGRSRSEELLDKIEKNTRPETQAAKLAVV